MERKIGEIFEYNGEWYQCINTGNCSECAFTGKRCYDFSTKGVDIIGDCTGRTFKKLEKVGESYYNSDKKLCQQYKCYTEPLIADEIVYVFDDNRAVIEIKQNKEDMGDLDKIKVRDYTKVEELNVMEENKLNLKPFDIQKAREGKPVCTRDGHKARIICFDYNGETGDYPIVALVHYNKGNKCYERVLKYTSDGLFNKYGDCQHDDDLMMLPEKKEGWINIIKTEDGVYCCKGELHSDYNDAFIENINVLDNRGITVKIEWEE